MIAQFALRLLCGMSLMWCAMPRHRVTSGFFRIQMLVALGLAVLAGLSSGRLASAENPSTYILSDSMQMLACGMIAGLAYLGSILWTLERRRGGTIVAFIIAALSGAVLVLSTVSNDAFATANGNLTWIAELSASALLGATVTGMLLGHWYLTAPTMSISPLGRLNTFLGVAATLRLLVAGYAFTMIDGPITDPTLQTWLLLRWIAGIFAPLAVFIMVWRIPKYKNTQAATGVLFVGVIVSFIGEMTAALLFQELSISL